MCCGHIVIDCMSIYMPTCSCNTAAEHVDGVGVMVVELVGNSHFKMPATPLSVHLQSHKTAAT